MDKGIKLQKEIAMGISSAKREAGGKADTSKKVQGLKKGGKVKAKGSCGCKGGK